jgi:hypothetical protein
MMTESAPYLGRCKQCDYTVFATEEDIPDGKTLRDILAGDVCRVAGREFAYENKYEMRIQAVEIPGVYNLFEIPSVTAVPA